MPERIVPFEENNYYHLFNRGVNKGLIFFSDRNYDFFLYKMTKYFQQYATILAYCLMPNHFHLLVRIARSEFISKALQPFLIAYTRAVNIDQERVGPLFQGRYKANKIEDEEYLLDCAKYIHLNPVKAGFVNLPIEWTYSSYHIYVRNKENSSIDTSILLDFFDSIKDFQEYSESDIDQYQSKYFKDYS